MPEGISGLSGGVECICVDCLDAPTLGRWWLRLIGGEVTIDSDGDVTLRSGTTTILFLEVPERKTVKNRLHLDVRAVDLDLAVGQAIALGASAADDVFKGDDWQVLRDPEGNEFCILAPTGP